MNPDLREMIIYAKGMGISYVDVSTNGEFDMSLVLGTGLNEIIVSCHKNNYKWVNLLAYEKGESPWPTTRIQVINFPENKERIKELLGRFGVGGFYDVIYVKNVEAMSQTLGDKNISQEEIDKRLKDRKPCKQLYFVLTVNSNGDIAYCCHDPKGLSVLREKTLKEAWDSVNRTVVVQNHRKGNYTDLCSKCCDYEW